MWRALPLPPRVEDLLQARRGLSRRQLIEAGASDVHIARLVRTGRLVRVGCGRLEVVEPGSTPSEVTLETDPIAEQVRLLHGLQRKFSDVVVAGRSASLVHGLPVWRFPPLPELIRHPERGRPDGVHLLRVCPRDVEVDDVDGLRVTTPARTAADMALAWETPVALVTVDAVLGAGGSLTQMAEILRSRGPVRHVRRGRGTLGLASPRSESALESFSRGVLVTSGLPRPWVNPWLRLHRGWVRVDDFWPHPGSSGRPTVP